MDLEVTTDDRRATRDGEGRTVACFFEPRPAPVDPRRDSRKPVDPFCSTAWHGCGLISELPWPNALQNKSGIHAETVLPAVPYLRDIAI